MKRWLGATLAALTISGGARAECEKGMEELQKRYADWQKAGQDFQVEVQKKQQEATQPILTKLVAIVKRDHSASPSLPHVTRSV